MFKNLMTALSDNYYLIAPYYPGFGFSAFPEVFDYTFKGISACMNAFTDAISLKCYGNAYDEGNGPNWDETIEYWKKNAFLCEAGTIEQYYLCMAEEFHLDIWGKYAPYFSANEAPCYKRDLPDA